MYTMLVRLMLIAAVLELGIEAKDLLHTKGIRSSSRKVLRMRWKPISIFPEEAKRFKEK